MSKREVLHVPGVEHNAPIPMAVKVGNMVYSSAIMGADPATGKVPEKVEDEVAFIFQHMKTLLSAAGGSTDHIAHVALLMGDLSYRDIVNEEWIKMFPNENDRPARHATVKDLRGGARVQVEITAVL